MASPLSKGWNYLKASFDQKIDENADPKVQIQQAVEGAKKRHQEITAHAAEIIGNQSRLEMQLSRLNESVEKYQDQARQALKMADEATDPQAAQEYQRTAEVIAAQLVAAESERETVKAQHATAVQAAEQARAQQKESEVRLKEQLAQVDALLMQADQAAMQEANAKTMDSFNQLNPDDSTPTLDAVRAKIEKRYTDALGAQELLEGTVGQHIQEIANADSNLAATARLQEIRAQMNSPKEIAAGEADAADAADAAEGSAESK